MKKKITIDEKTQQAIIRDVTRAKNEFDMDVFVSFDKEDKEAVIEEVRIRENLLKQLEK